MSNDAKVARVIRINTIGGIALLGAVALAVGLLVVGASPWDGRTIVSLVFGVVLGSLMLLTAHSARQDLLDPSGVERRFESGALAWSAVLVGLGLLAVVVIIVLGVLG